jgi:HD-GYP domain-containing protein (c-di-GMP phosphodiesterase class II)
MLRVPIGYAHAGMVLAMPIFHPRRPDTMLLKAGMVLDDRTVQRLAELRIKDFWIRYPGFEFIGEYICPDIQESHGLVTRHIAAAFDAVACNTHAKLDYAEYRSAISGLLSRLLANPKAAIFVHELADRSQPTLRHSSSVCMISLLMGLKLEGYLISERVRMHIQGARDVAGLGLAAMLHDIGMLRLHPEVIDRWMKSQDESDPAFQKHVRIGCKMIRESVGAAAAGAVLHHHQKFDGSGFPKRERLDGTLEALKGNEIHVYARIIAAADAFDRLRYPPMLAEDQPPRPIPRVLKQMLLPPHVNWLDPVVLRALLTVVPAYAPGSMVKLSSGEAAVVVECSPDEPCRPCVQVIGDVRREFDQPASQENRYHLRDHPGLSIVEGEGQDVTQDNFTLPAELALNLAADDVRPVPLPAA